MKKAIVLIGMFMMLASFMGCKEKEAPTATPQTQESESTSEVTGTAEEKEKVVQEKEKIAEEEEILDSNGAGEFNGLEVEDEINVEVEEGSVGAGA